MKFGESDDERATLVAKQAVRHLVHYSSLPALALAHMERATGTREPFPGQAVYDAHAAAAGLFLEVVVSPCSAGFEHVMFLTKEHGLTEGNLLACRRPLTPNRHHAFRIGAAR